MMNGLIIYLNTKCNIDCDYCFVTKKDDVFMDRPRFEKIVRWFMQEEGEDKQISFFRNFYPKWGTFSRTYFFTLNISNEKVHGEDVCCDRNFEPF